MGPWELQRLPRCARPAPIVVSSLFCCLGPEGKGSAGEGAWGLLGRKLLSLPAFCRGRPPTPPSPLSPGLCFRFRLGWEDKESNGAICWASWASAR